MTNRQHGFTIVELLIVIVVIGILAAIVIVAYNGVTSRASDNAVKSDLVNLAKEMEAYKAVSSEARYPMNNTELYAMNGGIRMSKGAYDVSNNNVVVCFQTNGTAYGILAASKTGNIFYISSTTKTPTSTSQTNNAGASTICPAIAIPASSWEWMVLGGSWNSNVK
jgi:general secretion pathway protein G